MYCVTGNVEWQDSMKERCLVMWRSPQEWGKLILQWVSVPLTPLINHYNYIQAGDQGLGASVCTLYEIHSGEYATDTEFYNMEPWMVKKAIIALAKDGKAEYIPGTSADDSDAGVKFLTQLKLSISIS